MYAGICWNLFSQQTFKNVVAKLKNQDPGVSLLHRLTLKL